jgi:transcriptional regulator with XRE-family HTH domain
MTIVANELRRRRQALGIPIEVVAAKSGASYSTIRLAERPGSHGVSPDMVARIDRALGELEQRAESAA